jgi:DNA polymerase-1
MKRLKGKDPSVAKWIEWKEVEKIRSTYGTSILEELSEDGRLRARFNAFGTATGRFSSSKPNLQNIPKRGERGELMRSLFWSGSDDRVLIKADYASIELWLAAVRWQDPYMQDALQQSVNMHVATAATLFGIEPEEVTKAQKATQARELRAPQRGLAEQDTRGAQEERHPDRRGRRGGYVPQV